MYTNNGCVLIRRINWFDQNKWPHVKERRPSVMLDHLEILRRYRGIEGELWPDDLDEKVVLGNNAIVSIGNYKELQEIIGDLISQDDGEIYDFLIVGDAVDLENGYEFLGYECGYLESPQSNFSCIFNDVLYGKYDGLVRYSSHLNENLLFSDYHVARSFLDDRNKLITQGFDLENDATLDIIKLGVMGAKTKRTLDPEAGAVYGNKSEDQISTEDNQ